ncbi:MAG: DNA-binding domain-containing protein [Rhizobacter sp.]
MKADELDRERERQRALMAALLARDGGAALQGWLSHPPERTQRGMQAYQANAGASAERSLSSTFPTVQALMGEESFAAMARAFWHARPPERGDLACFGEALPAFIADSEQLADVPYLADSARLDWLLAQAERDVDVQADMVSLNLMAELDPAEIRLQLAPGSAVLASAYPVVSVWRAHQPGEDATSHWAHARKTLAAGVGVGIGERAWVWVWRAGWRATVRDMDAVTARWMQSLLRGDTLATALDEADESFDFEPWLVEALQQGWLMSARRAA